MKKFNNRQFGFLFLIFFIYFWSLYCLAHYINAVRKKICTKKNIVLPSLKESNAWVVDNEPNYRV